MSKIIEIEVEVVHQTDKAFGLADPNAKEDEEGLIWLPKSQCDYDEADRTMQLPEWLALKKGLI